MPKLLKHINLRPEYQLSGLDLLSSALPPLLPEDSDRFGGAVSRKRDLYEQSLSLEDMEEVVRAKRALWSDSLTGSDKHDQFGKLIRILSVAANREILSRLCEVYAKILDLGGRPAEKLLAALSVSMLTEAEKNISGGPLHRLSFLIWYLSTLPSCKLSLFANDFYKTTLSPILLNPAVSEKLALILLKTISSLLNPSIGVHPLNEGSDGSLIEQALVDNLPPSATIELISRDLLSILSEFKSTAASGSCLFMLASLAKYAMGARHILASHSSGALKPFLTKLSDSVPTNHSPEKKAFLALVDLTVSLLANLRQFAQQGQVERYFIPKFMMAPDL